jgi:hypothetical protein
MLQGDPVGVAGKTKRQQRHVEEAFVEAIEALQARGPLTAENADGLVAGKAIVAGGYRGVGREYALAPHRGQIRFRGSPRRAAAQLAFQQRKSQQRGVPFVHVVHVYMQAQGIRHADAAHAQNDFLLQAIVLVAAVQVVCQSLIPSRISVQVSVEQVNGNDVAGSAFEVVAPGAHRYRAVFH